MTKKIINTKISDSAMDFVLYCEDEIKEELRCSRDVIVSSYENLQ